MLEFSTGASILGVHHLEQVACLYTGFTDGLARRVFEHTHKSFPNSFTARYVYDVLVFFEEYSHFSTAKTREKQIKGWRREKKLKLILAENPDWADLSAEWRQDPTWSLLPEARPRLRRKVVAE